MAYQRTYQVYGGLSSGHFTDQKRMVGHNVVLKDEIGPTLKMLTSGVLKRDMQSAAMSTAHTGMKWVKMAIDRGFAEGFGSIQKRKVLDSKAAARVMRMIKPHKLNKTSRHRIEEYLLHGPKRFGPQLGFASTATKNLQQAVNYAKVAEGAVLGWGSKSSPRFGNAVQEGLRGNRNSMSFRVYQQFTEKQRRFFAAIGLPIGRTNINMYQPRAAFFEPFMRHKERSGALGRVFNQKLDATIKRRLEKAALKAIAA